MKFVFICFVFVLFACCDGKKNKRIEFDSSVIELFPSKSYPEREVILQEVAEVKYIPLETNERSLLREFDISSLQISDSLIVNAAYYQYGGDIHIFDWEGQLKHFFNRAGKGPGEHGAIYHFFVDFEAEEVYIMDDLWELKFLVYDYEGNYKRTIHSPDTLEVRSIHSYDDNHLLVYMYKNRFNYLNVSEPFEHVKPYYLVSKADGSFVNLDLTIPVLVDDIIFMYDENDKSRVVGLNEYGSSPVYKRGNEVYVADYGLDTVYQLKDRQFIPYMVTPLPKDKVREDVFRYMLCKTERYTIFREVEKLKEGARFRSRNIAVDHLTGEVFECVFVNRDYVPQEVMDFENGHLDLPINCLVMDMEESVKFYEEVMGFEVDSEYYPSPGWRIMLMRGEGEAMLEIIEDKGYEVGLYSVGMYVEDLKSTVEGLKAKGIKMLIEPLTTLVGCMAMIEDPNGVRIPLIEPK